MNTLLFRTLLAFLAALLILLGIMSLVLYLGFQRSLEAWSRSRAATVEEIVRDVLEGSTQAVSFDGSLFVYDSTKALVYSNRGRGRNVQPDDMIPLEIDGQLLGYYYTGTQHFQSDAANQRFLESLGQTLWLAFGVSFLIALVAAVLFSRSLAAPAKAVASGLKKVSQGSYDLSLPERGTAEIAGIAQSVNLLAKQLAREHDIRRQWAQDVAHDLRTPISVLKAQFEGMRDGVLDTGSSRIDKCLQEISHVEGLIADLEELMSLESPEKRLELTRIDTKELIAILEDRFLLEMQKKNITFKSNAGLELFNADRNLIERALSNFLSNAVRHANQGGTIELSAGVVEDRVSWRVFNTGDPIPPEEIDKVLDRLYRGEPARNTPGSGLGLPIAKKIAELHGGEVKIGSKDKVGTTVEIVIPLA